MDPVLFAGWLICLVVAAFTCFAAVYGAGSMHSPRWRPALREAGREIVREHGLHARRASTAEQNSALALLGHWDGPAPEAHDRRLGIIGELVGGPRRFAREDLERRQTELLDRVLARQRAAAGGRPSIQSAARAWRIALVRGHAEALWAGVRWFLPRFVAHVRPIGERALTSATLVGAWCGLLYWGTSSYIRRAADRPPTDWMQVVGVVITFSCVVALAMVVAQPLLAVIRHLVGTGRGKAAWSWTAVSTVAIVVLAITVAQGEDSGLLRPEVVSVVAAALLLGGAGWTVARSARDRRLKVSARLENALFATVFLAIAALLAVREWVGGDDLERGLRVFVVACLLATAVPVVAERIVEYVRLRRAGRDVPVAAGVVATVVWLAGTVVTVWLLRETVFGWLRGGSGAVGAVGAEVPAVGIVVGWVLLTAVLAWPIRRAWTAVERAHNQLALEQVLAAEE